VTSDKFTIKNPTGGANDIGTAKFLPVAGEIASIKVDSTDSIKLGFDSTREGKPCLVKELRELDMEDLKKVRKDFEDGGGAHTKSEVFGEDTH
jgi:hypothetical protein